ncbi:MAG: outer membrane beta-barrel protein [Flavobacteriales bacterium]|nr:outer membrane beta-barrel protein [Flavobacteriales bacterium]
MAVVLLLSTTVVRAQKSGIGFRFGPEWSVLRGTGQDMRPGTGYLFGVYGSIWVRPELSIIPEIRLLQERMISYHDGVAVPHRKTSIHIPIGVMIRTGGAWYLHASVAGKFQLAASEGTYNNRQDAADRNNPLELGCGVGFGAAIGDGVDLRVRYEQGITSSRRIAMGSALRSNLGVTLGVRFITIVHRARTRMHKHGRGKRGSLRRGYLRYGA